MIFRNLVTSLALIAASSDASGLRKLRQGITTTAASPAMALVGNDLSQAYRASIKEDAMKKHLEAFQEAADTSGGIRAAGSPGWVKSLQYVAGQLTEAGYAVQYHDFLAAYYEEPTPPELQIVSSETEITNTMPANTETTFFTYKGSGAGTVAGKVHAINFVLDAERDEGGPSSACDRAEFDNFPAGGIALIQVGNCSTSIKLENAFNASASAIILTNEGVEGKEDAQINRFRTNYPVPILFGSNTLGKSFVNALEAGDVDVRMTVNTIGEYRVNKNIIVETTHGDPRKTIVVGGHLDSVFEGPGISDNGSGSAGVLELALQLKENGFDNEVSMKNKVRFAWWGAEDIGVIGSQAYVDDLSEEEIAEIAMYINMDMIGSPNFVRFILDGDSSVSELEPLPQPGSPMAHIEQTLHDYFDEANLPIEEEPFSNSYKHTDHSPFYDVGVPVTDIHTGVGGTPKTEEQAAIFGGQAGVEWDPCYHKSCDTIDNVNFTVMEEMTRAAAHAISMYGSKEGEFFGGLVETGTVVVDKNWEEFP